MNKKIVGLEDYCETLLSRSKFDDTIQRMKLADTFDTQVLLGIVIHAAKEDNIKLTLIDDFDYEMWFWELYANYKL